MRCLVTGGLGFIGSHLVKRLIELGHSVDILDDSSNAVMKDSVAWSAWTFARDIALYANLPHQSMEEYEWVFHLAAISRTVWAIDDPARCVDVNVRGSVNVLKSLSVHNPKARVVLASSNIVYGSPNPYRASKLAMEEYMSAYNELYGLNCIALRYSNVYGPGMRWDDPICLAAMRRSMVEKGYIELTGDGTQSRDFTHVHDIVEGTILAAQAEYKGVVDLTSGHHRTLIDMARLFGCKISVIPDRPGDTKHIWQFPERAAHQLLGWRPSQCYLPEVGIRDVLSEIPQEVRA